MALILVPLAGAQSYTVTDLGVITGGDETIPAAIDNHGWVAGHAYTNSEPYAFLWTPTEGIRNLGTLPGGIESFALGVNDSGTVVGFSGAESGNSAFLWTQKGGMQNLGTLGGGSIEVSANGINNSGQVVGYAVLADNTTTHAFLWTQAGGMQDLGTLGGDYSAAYAINDAGEVVGKSLLPGNPSIYHAFLWTQAGGRGETTNNHGTRDQRPGHSCGFLRLLRTYFCVCLDAEPRHPVAGRWRERRLWDQ
jgi:probable HAF family extracellular repeat protein